MLAMFLSGCLAGLAGVVQGLGITHNIALGFQAGYGFDAIALALLGQEPSGRRGGRQPALWHAARWGSPHAVGGRGSDRDRADRPGAGHHLYRRTSDHPHPSTVSASRKEEEVEVTVFSRGWGA